MTNRVDTFHELFELILYFYEYRDRPVEDGYDFFGEVKKCCEKLDLDFNEVVEKFELKQPF
ncbi:hypothetical protein RZN22_15175 [Bacillaceae bacterium S4-13-58]